MVLVANPHNCAVTTPVPPEFVAINTHVSQLFEEAAGVLEGVYDGEFDGVTVIDTEGVVVGVGVIDIDGVIEGVGEWLGVIEGDAVGVTNGIAISNVSINWLKLVILISAKLAIVLPTLYSFSNILVKTWGAVFSFTLT